LVERHLRELGCRTAMRLASGQLGTDANGRLQDLREEVRILEARRTLRQRIASASAREVSNQALSRKLHGLFSLNARPEPARTVVAVYEMERDVCRWRVFPGGKPREGELDELLDALKADDLLVTDMGGLGAECQVVEIESSRDHASATLGRFSDGRLADLEALYIYGCLHGYVLTNSGRRPVDWRSQNQPDLWERLFRLKNCLQVTFHIRGSSKISLVEPGFTRDSTQHSAILIRTQGGWEGFAEDDILAIEGDLGPQKVK
jgi:hypothetical protein